MLKNILKDLNLKKPEGKGPRKFDIPVEKSGGPDLKGPISPKEKKKRIHEYIKQFKDRRLT